MPSALPDGDPAPDDGRLPQIALVTSLEAQVDGTRPGFGVYLHVPFCRVRCGYCDFNTYTPNELAVSGANPATYARAVELELDLALDVLGAAARPVDTVFVGGGTPTMLAPEVLAEFLDGITRRFSLAPGAEVTTEANPDTVTPRTVEVLAEAGFTRISLGMQSAVPHVLATLDRTHNPDNVSRAVAAARAAGLSTSVDLIYGTPGESLEDWRTSLESAVALEPDHISAYALVVEEATRLAADVRRGRVPAPDDDDEAAKYELADEILSDAGFQWYEVSNWSRTPGGRCRHNEAYWRGGHWWGIGPGAHSHVGGVRWWNVKHPAAYADRLASGRSPAAGREVLTAEQRYEERVLLATRLLDGLLIDELEPAGAEAVDGLVADSLLDARAAADRRVVLTLRGRLLADTVVRRLLAF